SNKAIFHMGFINMRWFESVLSETSSYITITQGIKTSMTELLFYIDQTQTSNIYTTDIKRRADKKIEFESAMSIAKTSVQIAVLNEIHYPILQMNSKTQVPLSISTNSEHQPLGDINRFNLSEVTNPGYCQEKGHNVRGYKKQKADKENSE
ncbi:1072_t:CDS:2, partial [Gigaspora margarita]